MYSAFVILNKNTASRKIYENQLLRRWYGAAGQWMTKVVLGTRKGSHSGFQIIIERGASKAQVQFRRRWSGAYWNRWGAGRNDL